MASNFLAGLSPEDMLHKEYLAARPCTRLLPMWPGFDSQTRRHMWVEFVGSLLCIERFSPGTPVSSSPQKPTFDLIYFHC